MARKSIAQIFSSGGAYVPTKCSVHLRPAGNATAAWVIDTPVVIDAANFSSRVQKIILNETSGFTGSAALKALASESSVAYPIQAADDGKHYVYVRVNGAGGLALSIDSRAVTSSTWVTAGWTWKTFEVTVPDDNIHSLSFKLDANTVVDKIYISRSAQTPTGDGPEYTLAPYVTIHGRLATSVAGAPTTYHNQSWAVNTYDDVRKEGWYNFDLTVLSGAAPSVSNYAFVLTASGTSDLHYVIWDTANKVTNPVAYFDDDAVWEKDTTTSMAIRVYAAYDCLDEYNCVITTPEATVEITTVNDFSKTELFPRHDNTELVDDNTDGNDVALDVNDKILTLVIDQSGSMSWNDSTGLRHQFASTVIDALEATYPADIRFNLLKVNAEPAFSFFVPVGKKVGTNDVSDIIKESFRGRPENFAGFRVVRNPDRYPETAIDGEIVHHGYALAALDVDLEQNKQYYYTVYTYDHFDRFSDGVQIPVKTNVIDAPRGIPTFKTKVILGYDTIRDDDIVGMWNTDEGEGDYAYDFSDSNQILTLTRTRWINEYDCPTGRYGLRFNGVTSKAETPLSTKFNLGTAFSVMFWVLPFVSGAEAPIVVNTNGTGINWSVGIVGTQVVYRGVGGFRHTGGTLPVEQWSHVAVTYSAGTLKIYVNGTVVTTSAVADPIASASGQTKVVVGQDPTGIYAESNFFGKISHVHVHNVARTALYVATAAVPKTRFTALGTPQTQIPPDNGDRLVIASFDIPEDFNYNLIRVVRNHKRMPYYESDGDTVLEVTPTAGEHSYGLPYDYDLDSDYWFRIFTRNSLGNWCPIEDTVGYKIRVPDQDRPHIIVSCGTGCTTEINPGPSFGSCPSPVIETARGGNQKVHIKWTVPANADCTLVKIYYQDDKYVVYDGKTKWIVNSQDTELDTATPIFVGPSSLGEYVDRNVQNRKSGYYTVVFTDRLGKHSQLVHLPVIVPIETADDSGIPLLEALNVAYHIDDYDIVRITWDSPVTISSNNVGWFDDRFYFYGAICNLFGKPLALEYPDDVKIVTSVSDIEKSNVEDVFNTVTGADTADRVPKATFSVNSGGLITGTIRLRNSPIFSVLKSLKVNVSAEYEYSDTFSWSFPDSSVTFKTPLEMRLVNRDNSRLPTGDFTTPPCENDYESGGSDIDKSPYRFRVNGAYIRRKAPFVARAIFTYKGLPLRNATVTARLYDAAGGPCRMTVPSLTNTSRTLSFTTNSFEVKLQVLPVLDQNGNPTGVEEMMSYADIPMKVPLMPQSARLYARVKSQAFQSVGRMNIFYPTTLRLSLSATAPLGNGSDVKEQFARAWFIDPDYPRDESKIQVVPDLSVTKWTLTKAAEKVRKVPFYSTDIVPLINGVYSYTRSGTARMVFFGPAKSGGEGKYLLTVSTTVSGLTATKEQELDIVIPGGGGYQNHIPDPTAPRIFCEMDECINYMWADGSDWVKMRIFRNPGDPGKTLVNGVQAKYAESFRDCSEVLFPLPVGTVVTVSAPGYEIIWGSVTEVSDEDTGVKSLNTEGAFNALDTADITLGRDTYYNVYFRLDSQVKIEGCRDNNFTNCCGFDMATRICREPHEIGAPDGIIVSTRINYAGKPTIIFGGGPVADDNYARPPCAIVPMEPLSFKLVGVFVGGEIVEEVVVDGVTINQFIFEIKYAGRAVPQGVPLDVLLVANIDGEKATEIDGYDIYTYFGVPKTIYSYTSTEYPGTDNPGVYSFASFTLNPIPTNKNVAIGVGISTTYSGKIVVNSGSTSSFPAGGF